MSRPNPLPAPVTAADPASTPGMAPPSGSESIGRRHPVEERPECLPDREDDVDHGFLRCGVLDRTRVDRVVTSVDVQLLDNPVRRLVSAPQVARALARLPEPRIQQRVIDVE